MLTVLLTLLNGAAPSDLPRQWAQVSRSGALSHVSETVDIATDDLIVTMRTIQMPSPAPYGLPAESAAITLNGTGYSLTAPSSDNMGKLTISSNIGSPLASWVDTSLKQLGSCWRTAAP